jgi:UDP-N-acetylglucosamine 2-epimerase
VSRILSVVGARPQFIKAAPVQRALAKRHQVIQVHTGQHYDDNMSGVFFRELDIPEPDVHLGVGSGTHAQQTAAMFERLEPVIAEHRPACVVIYGDTNTTLAAAVVAAKLVVPIAHVEAGLRSFNRAMPEEQNRVVADHLSGILFCPTETAVRNLAAEGITRGVHLVGDVMEEALVSAAARARTGSRALDRLGLAGTAYALATVHRAENTNDPARLRAILEALNDVGERVVFPMHPRTRAAAAATGWQPRATVIVIEPQGYLDMIRLEASARVVLTDSGGVQKEAYWLGVPCVTLRDETEWVETLAGGRNVLVGADRGKIVASATRALSVPGSRFPAPGSQFPAPGSRLPVPDSRLPAPGSRLPSDKIAEVISSWT